MLVPNIIAPPMPCRMRTPISHLISGVMASRSMVRVKMTRPAVNTFLRPRMSPALPAGSSSIEIASI